MTKIHHSPRLNYFCFNHFSFNHFGFSYSWLNSSCFTAGLLCLLTAPAWSQPDEHIHSHTDTHTQSHAPHVHGVATLTLALDKHSLEIELEAPAMDIVGFEHAPRTTEQHQQLAKAREHLRQVSQVIRLDKQCQQRDSTVTSGLDNPAGADHHHNDATHASFNARYSLTCTDTGTVDSVTLSAFDHFTGIDSVQVQWVGIHGQGATTVTRAQPEVKLK